MGTEKSSNLITAFLFDLPWIEILGSSWRLARKAIRGLSQEGMYEVLDYQSTLELLDVQGKKAHFTKRKKVRYLQDNIIAYQDHAWGDGRILLNYKCSPGKLADRYRLGYKTHLVLSLREIKNRNDVDEFNIRWEIGNGFRKPDGFWDTDITHRTKRIQIYVIFPKNRPPQRASVLEINSGRTHRLRNEHFQTMPGGKVQISWEKNKPRLYEHYLLKWWW